MRSAFQVLGMEGTASPVRKRKDLEGLDCLIIPGGESTTISKLMRRFDLVEDVVRMASDGIPIMGTCAGCVLLSKEGDDQVFRTGTELLGLMDMQVDRNAYGRQRESFEVGLEVEGLEPSLPRRLHPSPPDQAGLGALSTHGTSRQGHRHGQAGQSAGAVISSRAVQRHPHPSDPDIDGRMIRSLSP